ncbi:MAG: hypothetical protein U1E60_23600 [Reyranellaceae bacterium]
MATYDVIIIGTRGAGGAGDDPGARRLHGAGRRSRRLSERHDLDPLPVAEDDFVPGEMGPTRCPGDDWLIVSMPGLLHRMSTSPSITATAQARRRSPARSRSPRR